MGIGILALLTGETGSIITIACFGAVTLYILSMITLLRLRKQEPNLERPFKVPFYPYFPVIALVIGIICMIAMITLYPLLSLFYFGILAIAYAWFYFFVKNNADEQHPIASGTVNLPGEPIDHQG
jgi:ethanolamine permease